MTQDQVYVPKTRSQLGLPDFKSGEENLRGTSVSQAVASELREAIGDSPIATTFGVFSYLLVGWPTYIMMNASGQYRYPKYTNHLNPNSVNIFAPHHFMQIIVSDVGVFIWLAAVVAAVYTFGLSNTFRVYLAPYLWVNHWLIMITFLQHTDPLIPHYRTGEFTFPRGALSTFDRSLLGDLGSFMGWIGATTTHGISETHVAHHVSSKIPHYHACVFMNILVLFFSLIRRYNRWEANAALHKRLRQAGIYLQGAPIGWAEMYRVYRQCQFVEDEGDIVFYKNAQGLAAARPVFASSDESDSGVELESDKQR
jgi:omega-6 fatty acid desaturase / acyl-lipid omega-6 desaturase (Delta-12 desaturase)